MSTTQMRESDVTTSVGKLEMKLGVVIIPARTPRVRATARTAFTDPDGNGWVLKEDRRFLDPPEAYSNEPRQTSRWPLTGAAMARRVLSAATRPAASS